MARERGFTLIEVLVVMTIIAILASALAIMVAGLIERAKVEKTSALVHTLSNGCMQYQTVYKAFPPDTTYVGVQNLHYYLGRELDEMVQEDPPLLRKRKPFVQFQRDWVRGGNVDPLPPSDIIDPWDTTLDYKRQHPTDPKRFLVRSGGPDLAIGTSDDVTSDKPE